MLLSYQNTEGPLNRRIYIAMKGAIEAGRFGADARLPSTRTLAADLKVSRNTVALAYEQLVAEGYIVARNRSMMRVSSAVAVTRRFKPIQLKRAKPKLSAQASRLMEASALPPTRSFVTAPLRLHYDFRYRRPATREFPRDTARDWIQPDFPPPAPGFGCAASAPRISFRPASSCRSPDDWHCWNGLPARGPGSSRTTTSVSFVMRDSRSKRCTRWTGEIAPSMS